MLIYIFIGGLFVSSLVMISLLLWSVKRGGVEGRLSTDFPIFGDLAQDRLDRFYHQFALFFGNLSHNFALKILKGSRRFLIIVRFIILKIEARFTRLINLVHGRSLLAKRGQVSPFLVQMSNRK